MTTTHRFRTHLLCASVIVGFVCSVLSVGALENTGFEAPDKGSSGYEYEPAGASWNFSPKAGLSGPNGPWKCNSTSPDPLGDQFAYLQYDASITQDMSGLTTDAYYYLSFYEAYRTQKDPGNNLLVILDEGLATETTIYSNANVNSATWLLRESDLFLAEKESYTLTFRSTYPQGSGDQTTIIDGVSLNPVISYVKVNNDANCDINRYKVYTHAIDFQSSGAVASINGVAFTAMSGSGAGFTRTVANGSANSHHGEGIVSTSGGLRNLMQGFIFNGSPNTDGSGLQTYTLSGLNSGTTYDLRIYTHSWGSGGTRTNTLVFDVAGQAASTGEINEDNATTVGLPAWNDSYYINYRFTATDTELVFTAANAVGSDASWHLYGLTCEEVRPAIISVRPADNTTYCGTSVKLMMTFDETIQKGTGNITLKRRSDDSVVATFDENSADVTVSGATVNINVTNTLARYTDYYVEVDAGAIQNLSGRDCPAIAGNESWNFITAAPSITVVPMSNDTDCDISASKQYTHKLDLGAGTPGALINGVQFNAYNVASNGTLNFSYAFSSGDPLALQTGNNPPNISGDLFDLMKDMYINNNNAAGGTTTWTLSGLTAGMRHNVRIYVRRWGVSDSRNATMVFDPDGAGPISDSAGQISEDNATSVGLASDATAYYINYTYRAVAGENLVITVTQHNQNNSWHLYGITNEVIPPEGTIVTIR